VDTPIDTIEIYDVDRELLLARHTDVDEAMAEAHRLAHRIAAATEAQLAANGEGHPGGIGTRVAVLDGNTLERLAAYTAWTHAVPAV
jgi:hypothetical protein